MSIRADTAYSCKRSAGYLHGVGMESKAMK